MPGNELIRYAVHQFNQLAAFGDNGFALSPGKHRRPESHDLDVLLPGKKMRNANRIIGNEAGLVKLIYLGIKKVSQSIYNHHTHEPLTDCLLQVSNQIFHVFHAHAQTDQPVGHPAF